MNLEWIVVETLAVLIDASVALYFLNSRFKPKSAAHWPLLVAWSAYMVWGLAATFGNVSPLLYDLIAFAPLLFGYLVLFRQGIIWHKAIGIILLWALALGLSLTGAGVAALLTNTALEHSRTHQDTSRLLAIIIIKMLFIVVFYILAKNHADIRNLKKKPALILGCAAITTFVNMLFIFTNLSEFNEQQNQLLITLSIGLLLIMIVIFIMYELFIREEIRSVELSARLQRMELESHFYKEIDAMYADMRTWRHDYKNNLTALRALAEHGDAKKITEYIDNISGESERSLISLQTGNLILDAVVSTKLWLAASRGIAVDVQAVYPEPNPIKDNDLCAIAGNLLDNAIEACERMEDAKTKKFISFSLIVKGKSLALTIRNSFDGTLRHESGRYLTAKDTRFHGIGLSYVDSIVERYQGHVLREHDDGVFSTDVLLPLIPHNDNPS